RTYAVGVLAGARGPLAPENLLFPPTCGGKAATGGWKKKGVLWRALPSKPPNRVTPNRCYEFYSRWYERLVHAGHALAQQVIGQHQCQHCFGDRDQPRQHGWVVPAVDLDRARCALAVNRLLRPSDRGGRLGG